METETVFMWQIVYTLLFSCLQETVRKNVETIVDELESDMITETFNNFDNVSEFVKDMCLSVKITRSRQERALRFLNFALHEEKCLREFFNVLRRRSNADLLQAQCLKCSTTEATHGKTSSCMLLNTRLTKCMLECKCLCVIILTALRTKSCI